MFKLCLGIPAVVIDVNYSNMTATVDYGDGVNRTVLVGISENRVSRGDIVIVHAGTIVSKISIEELLEQVKFFEEILGGEPESLVSSYRLLLEIAKSLRE
ncbi:MAG: HypC/HybG/HupF family hydrogenase formation chaperone [Desulfurococcaceae archaeon]